MQVQVPASLSDCIPILNFPPFLDWRSGRRHIPPHQDQHWRGVRHPRHRVHAASAALHHRFAGNGLCNIAAGLISKLSLD